MESVSSLAIIGHELSRDVGGTKHVRYRVRVCVECACAAGGEKRQGKYVLRRRYQHFSTLHERLRHELGCRAWVSAYTNQCQGYIPTQRVMDEGGYEGGEWSQILRVGFATSSDRVTCASANAITAK